MVFIAATLLIGTSVAFGSHFRAATLNWKREADTAANYKFTVTYTAGLRYSYPYGITGNCSGVIPSAATGTGSCPPLGQVLSNGALGNVTFVNPTTNATYGVRVNTEGGNLFNSFPLNAVVTKIVPAQDQMYVEYTFTVYVPKSQTVMPRVRWSSAARLTTLLEIGPGNIPNRDSNWSVESVLNLVAQQSPRAVMVATVPVKHNVQNTIEIPASAEQGATVELSIVPTTESLLPKTTPTNFTFSNVSPNTILFTPPQVGQYAVQLKATSYDANHVALATAPFEFLLQSISCLVNCPSVVATTPDPTPTVELGQTLTLPVTATAGNMSPTTIAIDSTPLPPGMSFTTSPPPNFPTVVRTYSWTPTVAGSYPVCFQGIAGVTNSPPVCVVFNAVLHNDPPAVMCSAPLLNVPAAGASGALASVFATVSDPDLNALTVSWKVNSLPAGFQLIAGGAGSTQADLNFNFPIGHNVVEATVSDGFTSATCTTSVSVDRLAQPVSFAPPSTVPYGTTSLALTATGSTNNSPTFVLVSGPATLADNILSFLPGNLGDVVVTASIPGNAIYEVGSATATISIVDEVAPVVTVVPPAAAEATSAAGAVVTFSASALDDFSGAVAVTCTPASGSVFALGTAPVTCSASDSSFNTGTASFSVIVQDTIGPDIGAAGATSAEATSAAGAMVAYVAPDTIDAVSGPGTAVCTPAPGSIFAIGITAVTCTAFDAAGNTSTSSFDVTVSDTTAPSIDATPNVSAEATSAAGAIVGYSLPLATDAVDGSVSVSCVPASGSAFAIGATSVVCSATDARGNSASRTFIVTVADTIAPVISAHGPETALATSAAGAIVNYVAPVTSDTVDGIRAASCVPASGSPFPLGATTVTCTATDAAGNRALASAFVVTIANNVPTFTPPANISRPATNAAGAVVTYAASGQDVENGALAAVCSPASGSTFPIGTTTVNCTVTDVAGLSASGSFTVTVTEVTVPGEMSGSGFVRDDDAKYEFSFSARERASGSERAQIAIRIDDDGRKPSRKDRRDRDRRDRDDRFTSRTVDFIAFSDDPTVRPDRSRKPQIDTVTFSGIGEWNGQRNYRYVAIAQDAGEPGRHRESITVTIWSPAGAVVAQFEGELDGGNIRSTRIRH